MSEAQNLDLGSEYVYNLEPVENYSVLRGDEEVHPSHELTFQKPGSDWGKETYMVEVDGDRVELVNHRVGSTRTYQRHKMIPPRYRRLLEEDGYEVVDAADNIGTGTIEAVREWVADQGVDLDTILVDVNAKHVSVTLGTNGYLEGEDWDNYIDFMRSHDEIQYADSQSVHYIDDADLPTLLEGEDADTQA